MLLASPSLFAQQVSINEKGLLKKIERSNADIVNPKKENKAATWLSRGETFYQAATEVSKNLYDGIDAATVMMLFGEPTGAEVVEIAGQPYSKGIFPYVDVYLDINNKPISWVVTKEIYPGALGKATEAYVKAYELEGSTNPKVAEKVQEGLKKVYDEYSKTIHIEALTMIDMLNRQVLPAVMGFTGEIARGIVDKKAAVPGMKLDAETDRLAEIEGLENDLYKAVKELERAVAFAEDYTGSSLAHYYRNTVIPLMETARSYCDSLELIVGQKSWPYPTYGEMLFYV